MIFLLIGLLASGISARVYLLSIRGGFFDRSQGQKSLVRVLLEGTTSLLGAAAFIISFFLYDWWWPLILLALSYWIVAPILVSNERFVFFYNIQLFLALVTLTCSIAIFGIYFEVF